MCIYLFSDGYMDQFGGSERKKFGVQKFKELLLSNQHLDMQKQKELITLAHQQWKGGSPRGWYSGNGFEVIMNWKLPYGIMQNRGESKISDIKQVLNYLNHATFKNCSTSS